MGALILRRLGLAIPTLVGVAVAVFFMLRVLPGDVVEVRMRAEGGAVSVEAVEAERARLGLDKPMTQQFADWMVGLARLDLGRSLWTERPVSAEIGARLGISLEIAVLATLLSLAIAVPLGVGAAVWKGRWPDAVVRLYCVATGSIPSFWLGILLILAMLWGLHWLPPLEFIPFTTDPLGNLAQMIWPALAIGARFSSLLTRLVRGAMIEALAQDYVRTARAKGLPERVVVFGHALRNALLPVTAMTGVEFAMLIGGLTVVEEVFSLNGVGRLLVQSISRGDLTMIQGVVMTIAVFLILINLMTDGVTGLLDPRARTS